MKRESIIEILLFTVSLFSLVSLMGIVLSIFGEAIPFFREVPFLDFITGKRWYPTSEPPCFGLLPLLAGSIVVTIGAMLVSLPIGLGTALYLSEFAKPGVREILKPFVELLAGIPSVIYGFFGMVILAPLVQKIFRVPVGLNAFTASLLLGVMTLPTIASIAEDALNSVPVTLREASLALGATKWETATRIVLPAAKSGILTSIVLGAGRAVGETMTVLMVAGGAAVIPRSIFQPVRPITATIAAEMGEVAMGSVHYHALFALAAVLFLSTLCFNILAERIKGREG
ncbi:phosphate ABC transporter permease subunit PstC [bacterium]|nr:MAG: phosphate ABC transporter permease subunit PstC [bacterium]